MSTNLATVEKRTDLAKHQEFSTEQVRILAETVAKGCDQNELGFFLNVCRMKQLDPFTGQVHCVKRWDSELGREKMMIQVGVSGFRVIAARTRELAGISEPEYDAEDQPHPQWSRVTVYRYGRDNEKIPYSVKARWSEYVQTKKDGTPNRMWNKMPYIMLAKCAESMALRKAFPDELSGMYTDEEMDQADSETGGIAPSSVKPPVSMPKSTDDKKPAETKPAAAKQEAPKTEPAKAQTASNPPAANADLEELSGEIVSVTPGKNGVVVLNVKGYVVVVPGRLATDDFVVGAKVLLLVAKVTIKGQHMFEAREIKMLVAPVEEGEIVDAEFTEVEDGPPRTEKLDALFDDVPMAPKTQTTMEAPAQPAAETAKPGTIGVKRAKRIYTIISQNHRNTNFTEEELKKILSALPVPIEHLRDLEIGMYAQVERWATGEEDFQEFWKD